MLKNFVFPQLEEDTNENFQQDDALFHRRNIIHDAFSERFLGHWSLSLGFQYHQIWHSVMFPFRGFMSDVYMVVLGREPALRN
jgi:hypothetical protein